MSKQLSKIVIDSENGDVASDHSAFASDSLVVIIGMKTEGEPRPVCQWIAGCPTIKGNEVSCGSCPAGVKDSHGFRCQSKRVSAKTAIAFWSEGAEVVGEVSC